MELFGTKCTVPHYEDPNELINQVILTLCVPPDQTNVCKNFSNSKNLQSEIQAYAKIAGRDWTFYVKTLTVGIGRNTDNKPEDVVDIDLGPSKVVSRRHASINYNLDSRRWELNVLGRNGLKIDGGRVNHDDEPYALHSGSVIDIGGTQMMFILPDSQPVVSPVFVKNLKDKRLKPDQKHSFSNVHQQDYQDNMTTYARKESVPSQGPSVTNLEDDLSRDESKDIKPPYSYATMITQAILSNPDGIQSLSEIYNWISSHFAYYRHSKTGWQNSIRHNLSLNKAFEKVPRRPNEPGKGMKWQIAESYKQDFLAKWNNGSLNKARRGSSVSRQLQLHLMKNKQLPESRPTKPYLQDAPEIRTNYLYPPQRHPGPPAQLPPPEFNFPTESPKQIHPTEAYTPERGRHNPNIQSSPALWNFVQFSTPMAPEKKDDAFYNSPVKGASDLKDVDLAKGFD